LFLDDGGVVHCTDQCHCVEEFGVTIKIAQSEDTREAIYQAVKRIPRVLYYSVDWEHKTVRVNFVHNAYKEYLFEELVTLNERRIK